MRLFFFSHAVTLLPPLRSRLHRIDFVNGHRILQVAARSAEAKRQWYAAVSDVVGTSDLHTHPLGARAFASE